MPGPADVEPGVYEHRGWAVFDEDGYVLDANGDVGMAEALAAARDAYPGAEVVLDSYGARERPEEERLVANQRATTLAMQAAGLEEVDLDAILRRWPLDAAGTPLGPGLDEAYALLRPHFPTERRGEIVTLWQDPAKAAESLLRGNFKMDKVPPALTRGIPPRAHGLSLAPNVLAFKARSRTSRGTVCVRSTPECRAMCLVYSGRNPADPYNLAIKIATTVALLEQPEAFCRLLLAATHVFSCGAGCEGHVPFVRLNVYSDIPWEVLFPGLFDFFPDLQFYDYTKLPGRPAPENYDLTFSYSGHNIVDAKKELKKGRRIAVVFGVRRNEALPRTFWGREVVDGDLHDLRPLDPDGVIVALRWKPPFGKREYEQRRSIAFRVFVVPCEIIDGQVVVAETPRYTPHEDE